MSPTALSKRILIPAPLPQTSIGEPLAQPIRGENNVARRGGGQQPLHHKCCERQQIEPPARNAADARQRLAALAGDQLGDFREVAASQPVMVNDVERIARMRHVGVRQGAPVAADGVESALTHFREPGQLGQSLVDNLPRALALAARGGEEVERPQRQGGLLGDDAIDQMNQFEAAAAQIAHDAVRPRYSAQHAERSHFGFFGAREHAHAKTAPSLHLGDEPGPVLGVAHRRGGDGVEARHAHRAQQYPETFDVQERLIEALRIEPAGVVQIAAEAAQDSLIEQGQGSAQQSLEHDQTDRVGTNVNYAIAFVRVGRLFDEARSFSRLPQYATSPGRRPASVRFRDRTDSDSS